MSRIPNKVEKAKKPEFDPSRTYEWEGDSEFLFKGWEVDVFNKVISIELSTKEAVRVQNLLQAKAMLNNILKEAYEEGIVREHIEPPKDVKVEATNGEEIKTYDGAELVEEAVTE